MPYILISKLTIMQNTYIYIKLTVLAISIVAIFSSCSSDIGVGSESTDAVLSGSYARMLQIDDRLYVIGRNTLRVLDTSNPQNPTPLSTIEVGANVESLFRNSEYLFVGSQEGMFIYRIDSDGIPQLTSETDYQQSLENFCINDPIVANDTTAYVTLSTSEPLDNCFRSVNELRIYDLADITRPELINVVEMQEPKGLGTDGDHLFVCERYDGIKAFDISDPTNLETVYESETFPALDLIPANGNLLVIGLDTIYQYDYTNIDSIYRISSFATKG